VTVSVLHVSCVVNVWMLQGVTMWRKFKLRRMSKWALDPPEIEFSAQPLSAVRDIP
jgi:hypothetical protein